MSKLGLYIHIPFCSQRCIYCHFATDTVHNDKHQLYFEALKKEILLQKDIIVTSIHTIYFGGGTPSLVNPNLISDLLFFIHQNLPVIKNPEITLECNPESVTKEKVDTYQKSGINRISLGLQAWQNHHLQKLNRAHNLETFLKAYSIIKKSKIKNTSIDLIFGLPNQTLGEWQESLSEVIKLKPKHISLYSLEYHPQTPLMGLKISNKISPISDNLDRQMYHLACEYLSNNGYPQYEISNFSKKGFESKHNLNFWKGEDFLGVGLSAASFHKGQEWENTTFWDKYLSGELPIKRSLSKNELKTNKLLLNIRLNRGLRSNQIPPAQLKPLLDSRLVIQKQNKISLTPKGKDLENQVSQILYS